MSNKRRGLGRGLGALIPTTAERSPERPVDVFWPDDADVSGQSGPGPLRTEPLPSHEPYPRAGEGPLQAVAAPSVADLESLLDVPGARFAEIPLDAVTPNPRQPRTEFDEDALAELTESIRQVGVLQPVVVREVPPGADGQDRYELVMGERRWRASRAAGTGTIPAIVRGTADEDLLRDALLENLHRSQLNPLEEAAAYQQLLEDFGCTHEQLAQRVGRSRPQISNTVRLLGLPPAVQRRVAAGVLSAGHARALLGLADAEAMDRVATRIVAESLSVRATEELVTVGSAAAPGPARRRVQAGQRQDALDDLARRLGDRYDTRVTVSLGRRKGRVSVEFGSVEDLERILALLAPGDPGVFPAASDVTASS